MGIRVEYSRPKNKSFPPPSNAKQSDGAKSPESARSHLHSHCENLIKLADRRAQSKPGGSGGLCKSKREQNLDPSDPGACFVSLLKRPIKTARAERPRAERRGRNVRRLNFSERNVAGGTSAGGTSAGGTSAGGTSAGGTIAHPCFQEMCAQHNAACTGGLSGLQASGPIRVAEHIYAAHALPLVVED